MCISLSLSMAMAKTKFASMLPRNTNKITVALVYAVVEWILILLLLFNSLLSYLIIKYAVFFGVEPPCPWCTINVHTDLVCEAHANQISKLGYCSNHRKLAQSQDMCLHCLRSDKCSLFPWRLVQNLNQKVGENGEEVTLKCCCCGVRLDHCNTTTMFASYMLPQAASPWFHEKQDWIKELEEDEILPSQFFLHYNDHDRVEDQGINNRSILHQMEVVLDFDINVEPKLSQEEQNSLDEFQEMAAAACKMHLDDCTASASEEVAQMDTSRSEADVSIGTEIPDIDNEAEDQESVHSYKCTHGIPSTSSANQDEADDQGPVQTKEEMMEFQCLSLFKDREHVLKNQPPFQLDLNEIEDDGVPKTPASVDSLNQFHRNLAFLEKRDFGSEESVDGSVTSELEGDEGVVTIESLKSTLRAERKSLQALYAELEEERSASAEAANQAMAMINRLQEEKAAMQMEAFQYQRMMEEQSEYDQEALQLMNDLMVKREKENQELEKELELYRRKLLHYETKEKMRVLKKSSASSRSGFSSATCSIDAEDSEGGEGDHNSTPVDTVVNLEESLADFEEERLSILAELKVLEEKVMLLDGDYKTQYEIAEAMEEFPEENGILGDGNAGLNGHSNGFVKEMSGRHHHQRRMGGQIRKSLAPIFDEMSNESGDMMPNSCVSKLGIEAEVGHVYGRLEGLKADEEFIKHCVSSLSKGDRGIQLLQDILQQLRDLRNVELHVRNLCDDSALLIL